MHRQDPLPGHGVVHVAEHGLLHLPGVFSAQNHHFAVLQAQVDAGLGGHAGSVPVGGEGAGVEDGHIRSAEVRQFLVVGPNQHVPHEKRVVGTGGDHPHLDPVLGVPAGESIGAIDPFAGIQVVEGPLAVDDEGSLTQRHIDAAPPDLRLGSRVADHSLVLG